ncbi:MAG TPA: ATP synthase F1 subunit delta [Flavobacteriales bacterium]|nr:ATP synthase F1 subunit delta [Flavobacteriales bacterium]
MKGTKSASRYAKSLMVLAIEQNLLEQAYADMKLIDDTCDQTKELQLLLKSPVVKADKKEAIMKAVFKGKLSAITEQFVQLIIRHRRENILHEISDSFVKQYQAYKKIDVAEIISAIPLKADIKANLVAQLKKQSGREVLVKEIVDPAIIGGLVVRIGDKQYDGSIARKLNDLKKDFSKNPYVPSF